MAISPPNVLSLAFVEELYAEYLRDPKSVPEDWQRYFSEFSADVPKGVAQPHKGPSFLSSGSSDSRGANGSATTVAPRDLEVAFFQERVDQLVRAYRIRGHMIADIDPLGMPAAAAGT